MKKMYLTKRFHFESAHRMHNSDLSDKENEQYFGKCQSIHGHNYFLEVTVCGLTDITKGYFVNLHELASEINAHIIDVLDHQYLNDVLPDCKNKPVTMEVVSGWIWETLTKKMPNYDIFKIRLWETQDNSVEVYK